MAKSSLPKKKIKAQIKRYKSKLNQLEEKVKSTKKAIKELCKALLKEEKSKKKKGKADKKKAKTKNPAVNVKNTAAKSKKKASKKETKTKVEKVKAKPGKKKSAAKTNEEPQPVVKKTVATTNSGDSATKTSTTTTRTKRVTRTPASPKPTTKPVAKAPANRGYKLSDWDMFILESLKKGKRILLRSELGQLATARRDDQSLPLDDKQLYAKLSAVLNKLANRHQSIRKHSIGGRGFAYGLAEWFDKNTGEVKKTYLPRK